MTVSKNTLKKITLSLVITAFAANAQASSLYEDAADFIDQINQEMMTVDTAYSLNGVAVHDNCQTFMDKNQVYGELGQYISRELYTNSKLYSEVIQSSAMTKSCPKYNELNLNQKVLIWTLTLATMAHFESSCSTSASATGPNGTAYGLYQLHKNKEAAYDKDLKICQNGSSGNPKKSSQCVLSMLNNQIKKTGQLFSNKSYWDVLRPNGSSQKAKLIHQAIAKSSLCKKLSM